jgi:hypothetical protein
VEMRSRPGNYINRVMGFEEVLVQRRESRELCESMGKDNSKRCNSMLQKESDETGYSSSI